MICTEQLRVKFGSKTVLDGITLPPLQPGDCLGLLGCNGAGKSTLIQAMGGFQPYQGKVSVGSDDLKSLSTRDKQRRIGYMPQQIPQASSLLPHELLWSSVRALGFNWTNSELSHRIQHIIEALGLTEEAVIPMHALSGGKRQLVGLALVMIREPELLLLDEPTAALDLHWRIVVLDLISKLLLQRQGVAVAAIHDLDLAARFCNKLALLHQGKLLAYGTVPEVLTESNLATAFAVEVEIINRGEDQIKVDIRGVTSPSHP